MGDIQKRVVITGDASELQTVLQQVENSGSSLYQNLAKEAERYSSNLREQQKYIEVILAAESKRLDNERQAARAGISFEKAKALEQAASYGSRSGRKAQVREVQEDYERVQKMYDADFMVRKQELAEASVQNRLNKLNTKGEYGDAVDAEFAVISTTERIAQSGGKLAQVAKRFGTAIATGMGIGAGLTVMGLVYEAVRQGSELQKSSMALGSTLGELDKRMSDTTRAAVGRMGMTTLEFNQYQKATAVESGGMFGANTRAVSLFAAQFEKAMGLERGMMQGVMPSFRLSQGKDLQGEIYQLLFDLNKSGMISLGSRNFARLAESLEYYNKLNMMQSQHMLNVDPSRSSAIMGALAATGLPFLSDQRMMQTMQGFDQGIRSPGNDYTRAFMFQTLGRKTGGDFVDTQILREQGIFGKGALESVLKELKSSFAGNRPLMQSIGGRNQLTDAGRAVTIALQSAFNLPWALSKNIVTDLLSDEEKSQDLFSNLSALSEGPGKDPKRYSAARKNVESALGTSIPTLANERTAFTEELMSRFHNFMGEMGLRSMEPMFKFLKGKADIFGDQPGSAMNLLGGAIGAATSGNFAEAVKKFSDAVDKLLNPFPDIEDTTDIGGKKLPEKFKPKGKFKYDPSVALLGGVGRFFAGMSEEEELVSNLLSKYVAAPDFQGDIEQELGSILDEQGGSFKRDSTGTQIKISEEKKQSMKNLIRRISKSYRDRSGSAPTAPDTNHVGGKPTGFLDGETLRKLNDNVDRLNSALGYNTEATNSNTQLSSVNSKFEYVPVIVG